MKKKTALLLAACIFMLLTACSGEKIPEYEELTAAPDSMELTSLQNSLIKVSYPKDDWIGQPMTDPLFVLYADTAEDEYGVNFNVRYSVDWEDQITQEDLETIRQELQEQFPAITLKTAEMRQIQGRPVGYVEYADIITDERIDSMLEEGEWTEEWIESIGGRETLLQIPESEVITLYAVTDGHLILYTGCYTEERHRQPLLDAMAAAVATTEWVGP